MLAGVALVDFERLFAGGEAPHKRSISRSSSSHLVVTSRASVAPF